MNTASAKSMCTRMPEPHAPPRRRRRRGARHQLPEGAAVEPGLRDRCRAGTGGPRVDPRAGATRGQAGRRGRRRRAHRRSADARRRTCRWVRTSPGAGTRPAPSAAGRAGRPSAASAGARGGADRAGAGDARSRARGAADDARARRPAEATRRGAFGRGAGRRRGWRRRRRVWRSTTRRGRAARRTPKGRSSSERPSSGVIAQRDAATGANVAAGNSLVPRGGCRAGPRRGSDAGGGQRRAPVSRAPPKSRLPEQARSRAGGPPCERGQGAGPPVAHAADHVRLGQSVTRAAGRPGRHSCTC